MQSQVYKAFRDEERKEFEEQQFSLVQQEQFGMLKKDFSDLSENFH
jgi:hypothetical protein